MFPKIEAEIKQALTGQERTDLAVLKLLKSDILAAAKAQQLDPPTDDICHRILQRQLKQYREAVKLYDQLEAVDQATDKRRELAVLEALLPPQLSSGELDTVVAEELVDVDRSESVNIGQLIKQVQVRVGDQSSTSEIAQMIQKHLRS